MAKEGGQNKWQQMVISSIYCKLLLLLIHSSSFSFKANLKLSTEYHQLNRKLNAMLMCVSLIKVLFFYSLFNVKKTGGKTSLEKVLILKVHQTPTMCFRFLSGESSRPLSSCNNEAFKKIKKTRTIAWE